MWLSYITFTFENCDQITISGRYVGDFLVDDIKTSIERVASNSINRIDTANVFLIEIHVNTDELVRAALYRRKPCTKTPCSVLYLVGIYITHNKRIKDWYQNTSDPFGIHERKVKQLAKIVHKTDAKIVMSSSWRYRIWNTPYEKLYDDEKKFVDLLKEYHIELIDITPRSSDGRRDKEILEWLSQHENEVDRFVILDDERFDLECFVGKGLVQTSSVPKDALIKGHWRENTGLKMKHVRKAIQILRTENK